MKQFLRSWSPKKITGLLLLLVAGWGTYRTLMMVADPTTPFGCAPQDESLTDTPESGWLSVTAALIWSQFGGTINDASCVESTPVHGIVRVSSDDEVKEALAYAKDNNLKVSIAGVRHSMGGQTVQPGNLVIDMLGMNDVIVNETNMTMTVGAGATWHDIQNVLHPHFAVSAMQSTDIFSVGGSISVNAHGMDHTIGGVENTIRELRVLLTDGTIVTTSRTKNPELYEAIVGGYGLVGIILSATLDIVPNDIYTSRRVVVPFSEFNEFYKNEVADNTDIGLMYTHLSTAPSNLLEEAIIYIYDKAPVAVAPEEIPPLAEISSVKLRRFFMNFAKSGPIAAQVRWWAEKYLEPRFESCSISRANAISSGEACFVARNEPMHDSVPYLYNNLTKETDILHEYFIPRQNIEGFVRDLAAAVQERDINLLNASVRVVRAEQGLLTYAPEEAFSVVLFINQPLTEEGNAKMRADTSALIDIAHVHQGRFFLPYQLYYTDAQLRTSYPNLDEFIARKRQYDPNEILQTKFWHHLTQKS